MEREQMMTKAIAYERAADAIKRRAGVNTPEVDRELRDIVSAMELAASSMFQTLGMRPDEYKDGEPGVAPCQCQTCLDNRIASAANHDAAERTEWSEGVDANGSPVNEER